MTIAEERAGAVAQEAAGAGRAVRVSSVAGDRLCAGCGFNLTGQPVVREGQYSLLIVRCPECSTVAALQEYPLLGRWAARWAVVLAGVWALTLLGAWVASAGLLYALSNEVALRASERFAERIVAAQRVWLEEEIRADETKRQTYGWLLSQPDNYWSNVDASWWDQQDAAALLAGAGGWAGAGKWSALWGWVWIVVVSLAMGMFWSVALLHLRGWRLAAAALLIVALGCGFSALGRLETATAYGWTGAQWLANSVMGMPFEVMSLGFALAALAGSMLIGRPIVRGLVRAFLPPRLRGGLAGLWVADGLGVPGVGRRGRA